MSARFLASELRIFHCLICVAVFSRRVLREPKSLELDNDLSNSLVSIPSFCIVVRNVAIALLAFNKSKSALEAAALSKDFREPSAFILLRVSAFFVLNSSVIALSCELLPFIFNIRSKRCEAFDGPTVPRSYSATALRAFRSNTLRCVDLSRLTAFFLRSTAFCSVAVGCFLTLSRSGISFTVTGFAESVSVFLTTLSATDFNCLPTTLTSTVAPLSNTACILARSCSAFFLPSSPVSTKRLKSES